MSLQNHAVVLALVTAIAVPAPAFALGGGPGCSDLPEYDRAVGALEGLSTCDMSVEEARRVVAAQQGAAAVAQPLAPVRHHRHHRLRPPHQEGWHP